MNTSTTTCPHCNAQLQPNPQHGEIVCSECQTVIAENPIDYGPEWRAFDAQEHDTKSRVGPPSTQLLHDKGLSTTISWKDHDAYGKPLSEPKRQQMQRLRTWDERYRTHDASDRTLKQGLAEIERMASALGLPQSVRETASVIYRRALNENLLPGRSIESVATSAVYAAARQNGIPRSLDEVTAVARVDYQPIARAYRYIASELDLAVELTDPRDYLPRFASELECSTALRRQAHTLLTFVVDTPYMSGKNPVGLAAAALYAASQLTDESLTQDAISDIAGVTVVTIRNHYRELLEQHDESTID
jgi:transcription initiation factor TFIIB